MIRRKGDKYVLVSKSSGRVLGRHDTKAEARKQERAIKADQARRRKVGAR